MNYGFGMEGTVIFFSSKNIHIDYDIIKLLEFLSNVCESNIKKKLVKN